MLTIKIKRANVQQNRYFMNYEIINCHTWRKRERGIVVRSTCVIQHAIARVKIATKKEKRKT